ncbi:MAG: paraquat-inducible protein A [Proteobacteria bacterium]|jgi:paraquat-inducible protein A|nr:paraquat-inducible protein A [Pseudomonadota bacterium]MCG6934797.1 paraquat-inducible protein A [Pseudomonadota bacterium]
MRRDHDELGDYPVIPKTELGKLRGLVLITTLLFLAGVLSPMLTVTRFMVVNNTFSVVSGIFQLLQDGQYILFIVVAGFSVVLPLLKLWVLYRLTGIDAQKPRRMAHYLYWMHEYGRWAMLDVMVVAVLIVAVKLKMVASIEVHYGLYLFGGAVLMMSYLTHRIVRMTDTPRGR